MTTNLKTIVYHLAINMTSRPRHVGLNRFLATARLLPQTFPQWLGKSCVTLEPSGRQGSRVPEGTELWDQIKTGINSNPAGNLFTQDIA